MSPAITGLSLSVRPFNNRDMVDGPSGRSGRHVTVVLSESVAMFVIILSLFVAEMIVLEMSLRKGKCVDLVFLLRFEREKC